MVRKINKSVLQDCVILLRLENIVADIRILETGSNSYAHVASCCLFIFILGKKSQ